MIFIIYTSPSSYCNLAENMLLRITKIKSNLTDLHGMHQLLFTPSHHLLVCCFILPHMYGDKLFKQIPILRLLNICILIFDGCKKNVKCEMFECFPFTKSTLKFFCLQQTFAKSEVSPSEPEMSLLLKLSDSGKLFLNTTWGVKSALKQGRATKRNKGDLDLTYM